MPPLRRGFGHGIPYANTSSRGQYTLKEAVYKLANPLRNGVGLSQKRKEMFMYTKFNSAYQQLWLPDYAYMQPPKPPREVEYNSDSEYEVPEMPDNWIRMPEYEEVMRRDEEALERFERMLAERNRTSYVPRNFTKPVQ